MNLAPPARPGLTASMTTIVIKGWSASLPKALVIPIVGRDSARSTVLSVCAIHLAVQRKVASLVSVLAQSTGLGIKIETPSRPTQDDCIGCNDCYRSAWSIVHYVSNYCP